MTVPAKSRLLALPAELRNRIYEYTFSGQKVDFAKTRPAPGLLIACKQIYREARPFYYSDSFFLTTGDPKKFVAQLAKLPLEYRQSIQHVDVDLDDAAKTSPCGEPKVWTQLHENRAAMHLMCCAKDLQVKIKTLRDALKASGMQDLAPKAKACVLLDVKGGSMWTSTPWVTLVEKTEMKLPEDHKYVTRYFDLKHVTPFRCWWRWCKYGKYYPLLTCGCLAIEEED